LHSIAIFRPYFSGGRLAAAQQFLAVGPERSIRADVPVERLPGKKDRKEGQGKGKEGHGKEGKEGKKDMHFVGK
jgi:hypothetical protein